MTIASEVARINYLGSGTAGPFSFPFRVLTASHLRVIRRRAGTDDVLVPGVDYTITGVLDRNGGTITLSTALASGETLAILRAVPLTQDTNFRDLATFLPEYHEDAFDKQTMGLQTLADGIGRSFRLGESVDPADVDLTVVPDAGRILGWNSDGTALEGKTLDDSDNVILPGDGRTVATLSDFLANNVVYNVKDYGAVGDGVTDDTAAFLLAYQYGAGNGAIRVPAGQYMISDTLAIALPWTHFEGDGTAVSLIWFNPSSDKTLFLVNEGITSMVEAHPNQGVFDNNFVLSGCSIRNLAIVGHPAATAFKKTLIKSIDTSLFTVENVTLRCDNDLADSIGLELRGREFTTIANVVTVCPQPMIIGVNPNYATLCADHLHVRDYYSVTLKPSGGVHVLIEDRAVLSNVTFDGEQSYAGGESAFIWNDTRMDPATGQSAVGAYAYASNNVTIANARFEQATGGGWFVRMTPNMLCLTVVNAYTGFDSGAIYLRNTFVGNLGPMVYTQGGGEALDLKFCHAIRGDGCYFQDNSTVELNSGNMVVAMESPRTSAVRPIGEWFLIQAASHGQELAINLPRLTTPTILNGIRFGDTSGLIRVDGVGAATAFVALPASSGDDRNYQLDDHAKRFWSAAAISVYDSGVLINPAVDPYTVSRTIGALSFTNITPRVITISGEYYPPATWGSTNRQGTHVNFSVADDGTVDAFLRLRAPSFVGTGATYLMGLASTQSTSLLLDGAKQFIRGIYLRTAGANRGFFGLSSVDETGGSAGSSVRIIVYTDATTPIVALDFARADGAAQFIADVTAPHYKVGAQQVIGARGAAVADVASANATDLPTAITLANELKTQLNLLLARLRIATGHGLIG